MYSLSSSLVWTNICFLVPLKAQTPILLFHYILLQKILWTFLPTLSGQGTLCGNLLLNFFLYKIEFPLFYLKDPAGLPASHWTVDWWIRNIIWAHFHQICVVSWAFQLLTSVTQIWKAATWASLHMFMFFKWIFRSPLVPASGVKCYKLFWVCQGLLPCFVLRSCWGSLQYCSLSTAFRRHSCKALSLYPLLMWHKP